MSNVRRILLILAVLATSTLASASEVGRSRKFGLGLTAGAPSGLSMKFFLAGQHALDLAVGTGFYGGASLDVHLDYHSYATTLTQTSAFELPLYIGIGGRFNFWFSEGRRHYWGGDEYDTRFGVGVRVPIGIAFHFNKVPVDLFLEIVPVLGVYRGIGVGVDGAIGARYYF